MAKTILVPTDFSVNSKAGIRFALQLEKQGRNKLVFYHCLPYMKPTRWSDARYDTYSEKEKENATRDLRRFVKDIYRSTGLKRTKKREYVVQQSPDVKKAIVNFAKEIRADAICMGTRGAGRLKKIIGTHASGIVNTSPIPVFVIPRNYRRAPVKKILYSSDLNQIGAELKVIRNVARQLKAKVLVYHYDYLAHVDEARKKLDKIARRHAYADVTFKFKKYNIEKSLAEHLLKDMHASGASLAVLFTDQKRGWFDKLFLSSKSLDVAFGSKIPLMIFPKE